MRFLICTLAIVCFFTSSNVKADLVSVSLDFSYDFDSGLFDTVSGNLDFTVDNSVSVAGKAVDLITFTDPQGHFQTNDVFVDFREGDDTNIATNQYEFDIYHLGFSVFSNHPGDFLLRVATLSLEPGDSLGSAQMGTTFLYFNGNTFDVSQNGNHHLTVSQAVPEPALAGILGLAMPGFCVTRRRRTCK